MKALEAQVADWRGLDHRLDQVEHPLADQDLPGLRLVAQARGEIGDAADAGVVEPPIETDLPERGIAERNADAEAERMAALAPDLDQRIQARAHVERHAHGALGMVRAGDRMVEMGQGAVTGEPLQRYFVEDE